MLYSCMKLNQKYYFNGPNVAWPVLDHSQDPQRGVAGVLQEASQLVVQVGNGKSW